MRAKLGKWWPILKALFTVAILAAIGRHFARVLQNNPELWQQSPDPGWLVLSAFFYIVGLGMSTVYWIRLLRSLGQRPSALSAIRAYYIGHLGKYLPGKAWALLLRATLMRGPGVSVAVAGFSSLYEVLTTMASGVLLAALLFAVQPADHAVATEWKPLRDLFKVGYTGTAVLDWKGFVALSLILLAVVGVPIIPGVFNKVIHRLSLPFKDSDAAPFPHIRLTSLVEGLALTAVGWALLGASLWSVFAAIPGFDAPLPTWHLLGRFTAFMGLGYVAGFVIVLMPSGLGVREYFLTLFLVPAVAPYVASSGADTQATVVLAVLLLRLVWTAAEVVVASIVYWFPVQGACSTS